MAAVKKTTAKTTSKASASEKTTTKKTVAKKSFETLVVDFQLKNETPGTFRFEEIDGNGAVIPNKEAIIGGLYLRIKDTHKAVKNIRVTVEEI